jgi:hypothetical protein
MVDLLQFDLLPAQRDLDFAQFGDLCHVYLPCSSDRGGTITGVTHMAQVYRQ